MSLIPEIPTPKKLLKEAKAEPHQHPYDLSDYIEVIDALVKKGFSFEKIAKWLSPRLEGKVKRGQVFYVYRVWQEKHKTAESWAILQEQGKSTGDPLGEPPFDPDLAKMIEETQDAQLDAEADKEDAKRKAKRKKP